MRTRKMMRRLISVWVAVCSAGAVAWLCRFLAGEAGRSATAGETERPILSAAFYPDSSLVYLHPLPLIIWALVHTIKRPGDCDQSLLIITTTVSASLIFIVTFVIAMILPHLPIGL